MAIAAASGHRAFVVRWKSLDNGAYNTGELGNGTLVNTDTPQEIVTGNVTAVAAGGGHTLFLKSDGSLWAMGNDGLGQLGDGTNGIRLVP